MNSIKLPPTAYSKGNNGFGGKHTQCTETSDESNGGYVMHSMRFGSATKYVRSQDLVKSDLTSSFGELVINRV